MGILDRLKKVAQGVGSVATAPLEFVWDVGNGAFTDAELDIWGEMKGELGEALGGAFGPQSGLGAAAGALPKGIRRGVATPIGAGLRGLETAYREGVGEPISTALTVGSLASRGGGFGDFGELLEGDNWRAAYKTAQTRSPGQALALAFLTKDITDDSEVDAAKGTAGYKVISGASDAVLRLSPVDPFNRLAILGKAGRLRYIDTPVSRLGVDAAMDTRRVERFLGKIADKSDSHIADQFFSNNAHGGQIGFLLGEAGRQGGRTAQGNTLRTLMGDGGSFSVLQAEHADLAHQIQNLMGENLQRWGDDTLFANADEVARVEAEMEALYPQIERVDMAMETAGAVKDIPRYSLVGELRSNIGRSVTYQNSPLTRPLKVITNKAPHHWVDLNDPRSHNQVWRQLRDSRLPIEEQDQLRAAMMAAPNAAARQKALVAADEAAVRSVLDHHGISQADIDALLANHREARNGAMGALRSRKYDAEGRGSIGFTDFDGTETRIDMPLYVTQQADLIPLSDLKSIDHLAETMSGSWVKRNVRGFREAHPSTRMPTEAVEAFYRVWRPTVLLRFGWPQRIVLDEQLRIMSEIGVLRTFAKHPKAFATLGDRSVSAVARKAGLKEGRFASAEVSARAIGRLDKPVTAGGEVFDSAFGPAGDPANVFLQNISAKGTFREIVEGEKAETLTELRKHTGKFKTHRPGDEDYDAMWGWAVNKQIRQDALGLRLLGGESVDDGVKWLMSTPEGVAYARKLGWKSHTFRAHVDDIDDQISRYLPGDLRADAAAGDLSSQALKRAIPDEAARPPVHGEELAQALGRGSQIMDSIRTIERESFNALGTVPTDVLSRQPYFAELYSREIDRLAELTLREGLPLDEVARKRIAQQARRSAVNDTQTLLYDLAERSELTEILRFMAPFYSATQEIGVTWARQTWKQPAFTARARYVWSAPERNGLVHDENGNTILPGGGAENPLTGEKVKAGSERYITLPFDVPGLPTRGAISMNKRSFNLLTSGAPSGPIPQALVNEVVKDRPDLAKSLEWLLPFGSTQETLSILMPAVAKRLQQRAAGEEDRVYANSKIRMMYDRQYEFRSENGRWPNADEYDTMYRQLSKDTATLFSIRAVASFVLPFAPIFDSPYKPYIDTYRQMQERVRGDKDAVGGKSMIVADEHGNPRTVHEWFTDEYGPEALALAQSLSSSRDGVMPTLEGFNAREKYKDLIEQYPTLGGFFIGAEGAGEFNRSVYDYQLAHARKPGSGTKQRETPSFEEAFTKPEIAEGWMKYQRAMDLIDAARVDQKLPSLEVAAAAPLKRAKQLVTAQLTAQFPAWWEEFNRSDRLAFKKKLDGFTAAAQDPRLKNRDDVRGVRDYLKARGMILDTLRRRSAAGGAKTLTATSNQDIALVWSAITSQLVERNLAFGDVFYRFLERDPLLET